MKTIPQVILIATLVPASFSQSVLYTFVGDSSGVYFGSSVSGAGDVNGDGFPDLIVGAYNDINNGVDSGSARVLSGADGSILYTFDGDSPDDRFGYSVSAAGDVNGDGFADLIVGAPQIFSHGTGYARVFSGADGSTLFTFYGDTLGDWFGHSVSGGGDVNGDGYADLIVGAPKDSNNGWRSGSARVFSGLDGSILRTFDGHSAVIWSGWSVSGAGDVNGDGYADLIVGAHVDVINGKNSGSARVYSGKSGIVLYVFNGVTTSSFFGHEVSSAGDVNGDGHADLIIGAPGHNANDGSATVFSGQDGSILYTFHGDSPDRLGHSVSGAGDVNGDGYGDLIVGMPQNFTPKGYGSVRVFSGIDGSVLQTFDGVSGNMFGRSVSGAGDVNGDGFADLIVGAYDLSAGSARVFSGSDTLGTSYCSPAVANSSGQSAVISASGSDLADGGYFMLHAADLPLDKFGYFLASQTQGFVANPGGSQGNLCLGGQIGRFAKQIQNSGSDGSFHIQVDLTNIPTSPPHTVLAGETWNFQAWFRDKNPGNTSNFTDGVTVTFN